MLTHFMGVLKVVNIRGEARGFAVWGGSQRGSGAEPSTWSRAQCDKGSSGGSPIVPEIFFIGSVQIL